MKILAAILAAGQSSRFGRDKLSADFCGMPMGRWAFDTVVALDLEMVWIGHGKRPSYLNGEGGYAYMENPNAHEGLSTSLRIAANAAIARGAEAVLVTLADMPLVTADMLRNLLAKRQPSASLYPDGKLGVPALLTSEYFAPLQTLTGDQGAGALLNRSAGIFPVVMPAGRLCDVDTPAGLEMAAQIARSGKE
jgi:molybdenum cofactor cytidylyltransferase